MMMMMSLWKMNFVAIEDVDNMLMMMMTTTMMMRGGACQMNIVAFVNLEVDDLATWILLLWIMLIMMLQ
jgi:hypothetical protein